MPPLENGPYIKNGKPNGRPKPSGEAKLEFEKAVYNKNIEENGVAKDIYENEVINWKPGQKRKGVVDFGHKKGEKYKNREISLDELKKHEYNPDNFQLETPSSNRSHKHE